MHGENLKLIRFCVLLVLSAVPDLGLS